MRLNATGDLTLSTIREKSGHPKTYAISLVALSRIEVLILVISVVARTVCTKTDCACSARVILEYLGQVGIITLKSFISLSKVRLRKESTGFMLEKAVERLWKNLLVQPLFNGLTMQRRIGEERNQKRGRLKSSIRNFWRKSGLLVKVRA